MKKLHFVGLLAALVSGIAAAQETLPTAEELIENVACHCTTRRRKPATSRAPIGSPQSSPSAAGTTAPMRNAIGT